MAYTNKQLKILRDFCLTDSNDHFIEVRLLRPEDRPLGTGPKLEPKVVNRLMAADTTEGQVWLEWIFHQAAGGDTAKESSERALEQMKQRFMDERLHGYQHARTRKVYPKIAKEEAESRWLDTEPRFREVLFNADQDSVEKLGVWGFYRHWPGKDGIYEKVTQTVQRWQALRPKVEQMNEEIVTEGKERIPLGPQGIASVDALAGLVKKVERYYASKAARQDIRLAKWRGNDYIYNDDYIVVVAPLTYATAVRYGNDAWRWANRDTFERVLLDEQAFADEWKSTTQRGSFYAYLRFKCPVPRWVSRRSDKFYVHELTNLAVELNRNNNFKNGKVNLDTLTFWDEEGRNALRAYEICNMIQHELHRALDEEQDMPIKRGQNVYSSGDECEAVIIHFKQALAEIGAWAEQFQLDSVVTDALGTLNATKLIAEVHAGAPS